MSPIEKILAKNAERCDLRIALLTDEAEAFIARFTCNKICNNEIVLVKEENND